MVLDKDEGSIRREKRARQTNRVRLITISRERQFAVFMGLFASIP